MRVIIVSDTKQFFNGKNYWKDQKSGYYRNASAKPHSLHRQVWMYHYGEIDRDLVVDHIDRDKGNNQIENLRLVTKSENNKNVDEEEKQRRINWMDEIRPLTKEWHKSNEGKKWHSQHGVEAYKKRKPIEKICAHCGKKYLTTQYDNKARFCCLNCKMRARTRRLKGLPENYGPLR